MDIGKLEKRMDDALGEVKTCWYNPATMIIRLWKTSTATGMTQTMCNAGMSSRTRRSCSERQLTT